MFNPDDLIYEIRNAESEFKKKEEDLSKREKRLENFETVYDKLKGRISGYRYEILKMSADLIAMNKELEDISVMMEEALYGEFSNTEMRRCNICGYLPMHKEGPTGVTVYCNLHPHISVHSTDKDKAFVLWNKKMKKESVEYKEHVEESNE
jgi:hypothetical protein